MLFRSGGKIAEHRTAGVAILTGPDGCESPVCRAFGAPEAASPSVPISALCGKTGGAVFRPAGFGLRKYSIRIMEKLIRLLHEGNYSLVVAHGEIRTFSGRGVSDLYALSGEDPGFLRGASVADKVVGKAAAALMIVAGVSELHADVISRPALDLLAGSGVKVGYAEEVPDRKSTRLNSSHPLSSRMPSSA